PSFENSDTLMGKYGEEGDRLIFKILNSGDYLSKVDDTLYQKKDSNATTAKISEKALRYDLTVPFARYVVQHQNEIEFPFKRYQMQPVWRADRPQKGRFREFYQCDADVVGSDSLFQEVEFIQLYDNVFSALKLEGVTIKINNRKILSGIAEVIGASDKLIDFTVALDKLDKIGEEKVKEEMLSKGISQEGINKLQPLFTISGTFESQIESLKPILSTSEEGTKGIEELSTINKTITALGLKTATLQLDVTLARGLNYYTGAIFEVAAPKGVSMGSIGGGGRYDDLTGIFGLKNVSGVGISFGLDRIYLVLEELGLFPTTITKTTEVLFINFGDNEAVACLKAIQAIRENSINAELYPDAAKMKKQMNYANKRTIPFVVLVGEEELKNKTFTLKNMESGEQSKLDIEALVAHFN
ncbi:MAG: histidine--tRNA ligase, partial [Bizionia sp.]|nr:histidine--tRNA ligase [Bizionia sp.]